MKAVFKTLIEILSEIRTPLIFWSFVFLIFLIGFYIFSKNNDWFISISSPIIKKLTKSNLFKITKLIVVFFFIAILTLIILAFISPLINSSFEKKYDRNVIEEIRETSNDIIETIDNDDKYRQIIKLYESGNIEHSRLLTEEVFNYKSLNQDEYLGYTVASYFAEAEYKKAAKLVLERDKSKPKWDYSLKNDLAQCIRSYTIKNGRISGIELIRELQSEYGDKIVSFFWTVLPIEYLRALEFGFYSTSTTSWVYLDDSNLDEIKELIKLFPNDKFIDYAYYAIEDYKSVLSLKQDSRIKDLALFGMAYSIIQDFRLKFSNRLSYFDRYFILTLISVEDKNENLVQINNAIKYFNKYVNISEQLPQSDDAYYWLGWLEAQKRNYSKAIKYLNKAKTTGNKDYTTDINTFLYLITNFVSDTERGEIIKCLEANQLSAMKEERYYYLLKSDPIEAISTVLNDPSYFEENTINRIIENQIGPYGNLDNCLKIYNTYYKVINIESLKDIYGCVNSYNYDKTVNTIINLRKVSSYRTLCYQLLDKAIQRFTDINQIEYFKYLKIRIATIEFEDNVEELVNEFLKNHSKSEYCDDVLAELIYLLGNVLWFDQNKIDGYYNLLKIKYPKGNAIDNAMYWLAKGYDDSWGGDQATAKKIYLEIISDFPHTRFARYSAVRINEMNKKNQ